MNARTEYRGSPAKAVTRPPSLSEGEIAFLWWFIQGSIMIVETRHRLWRAWGLCERHGFAALAVDAAFRQGFLMGSAMLYADLMSRALRAFRFHGPFSGLRLSRRLREHGPCMLCELGLSERSIGFTPPGRLATGRDYTEIRRFLRATQPHWTRTVCGRCSGGGQAERCRVHLLEDLAADSSLDSAAHSALVDRIARQVQRFSDSFRWELRGSDTPEDRAALVSAVGWCGGWPTLLSVL